MSTDPLQDLLREADDRGRLVANTQPTLVGIPRGLWNDIMDRIGHEPAYVDTDDPNPEVQRNSPDAHGHDTLLFERPLLTKRHEGHLPTGDDVTINGVKEVRLPDDHDHAEAPVHHTHKDPTSMMEMTARGPSLVVNTKTGKYRAHALEDGVPLHITYTVCRSAPQEDLP